MPNMNRAHYKNSDAHRDRVIKMWTEDKINVSAIRERTGLAANTIRKLLCEAGVREHREVRS